MSNLTSRLAINIRYLPDFSFSWSDCTPQQPRSSLTISDFLPSEVDAAILKERATQYMMTFLVDTFTDLKPLSKLIPPTHPITRSHIVPMKILFLDEKYKSVTLDILSQLLVDAGLSGDQQVCIMLLCMHCYLIIMTIAGSGGRPAHMQGHQRMLALESNRTRPKRQAHMGS